MKKRIRIPKKAKKVFQGVMYDVYQWKQKLYDGNVEIFERVKRPNTVVVLATVGDKILIQDQVQPLKGRILSLPGGRMDLGEKPRQAAKREFLEETGYISNEIVLWKTISSTVGMFFDESIFIFRDCQKIQEQKLDAGERIKCRLVSFEELLKLSDEDSFRHKALAILFLRMRLSSKEKAKFKKLLLGK